jgi:hypothetical protein
MAIEAAVVETGGISELAHRHRVEPMQRKEIDSAGEDALARVAPARPGLSGSRHHAI